MSEENIQHYIVFVHGMADPRKNELLPSIISRFVEVRESKTGFVLRSPDPVRSNFLTLGSITSQTGKARRHDDGRTSVQSSTSPPWVEFERLPQAFPTSEIQDENRFDGRSAAPDAKRPACQRNFRFVDVWWADIADGDADQVWIQPLPWIRVLLARINRQLKYPKAEKRLLDAQTTAFHRREADRFLTLLEEALIPIQLFMSVRLPQLYRQVFFSAFGDVQLYTEYKPCKGKSIRRFHEVLAAVYADHYKFAELSRIEGERVPEPRFTILAHSLGTVLSLDALAYARTTIEERAKLPGYYKTSRGEGEIADPAAPAPEPGEWIACVRSLVTLGSPLSKFLAIWPRNFAYLNNPAFVRPHPDKTDECDRIVHLNFSEEQDPVGDRVASVRDTRVYRQLFAPAVHACAVSNRSQRRIRSLHNKNHAFCWFWDIIYRRSVTPGMAHTAYWTDPFLFSAIIRLAIDQKWSFGVLRLNHNPNPALASDQPRIPDLVVAMIDLESDLQAVTPPSPAPNSDQPGMSDPKDPRPEIKSESQVPVLTAGSHTTINGNKVLGPKTIQPLLNPHLWRPKDVGDNVMAITYVIAPLLIAILLWASLLISFPAFAALDHAVWSPPVGELGGYWKLPEERPSSPIATHLVWVPLALGLVFYLGKRILALFVGWRRILTTGASREKENYYPRFGQLIPDSIDFLMRWTVFLLLACAFLAHFINAPIILELMWVPIGMLIFSCAAFLTLYLCLSRAMDRVRFEEYCQRVGRIDLIIMVCFFFSFISSLLVSKGIIELLQFTIPPVVGWLRELAQYTHVTVPTASGRLETLDPAFLRRVLFIWLLLFCYAISMYYVFGMMVYERFRDRVFAWIESNPAQTDAHPHEWHRHIPTFFWSQVEKYWRRLLKREE